jgi:hypothetical protein
MNSETCFGEMLEQYSDFAQYELNKYDLGELASQAGNVQSKVCDSCTAGDGTPKHTYDTKNEAETQADIISEEDRVYLRVYRCKHGGWHLTKSTFKF